LLLSLVSCEYEDTMVKSLKGSWRFIIGDNKEWADPEYNDSEWDRIFAPMRWERQNYYNYNGYAWYRKSFRISTKYKNTSLYLYLGRIDDVDEVYVNGKLVGSTGSFPPDYKTAYNISRKYPIPTGVLNYNEENIIAVRVYDHHEYGGITNGDLGIYISDIYPLDVNLEGDWKFQINDSLIRKEVTYNDKDWYTVSLPGYWENQGFDDYDGFAWYRKKFDIPHGLKSEKLVLLLGKIDDNDQVYMNGELLGFTGEFNPQHGNIRTGNNYREFRGYYIPDNIELKDTGNIIAIRVYDSYGSGGLYEGPVGLITQEKYSKFWYNKVKKERRVHYYKD
jgi:hypothetical protein